MGARSRRARKIRTATEFDVARLESELRKPRDSQSGLYAWNLWQIYTARDEQTVGTFVLPSRMAEAMRTDDAIYTAYENRLAPQRCIPIAIDPAPGARGAKIADEAGALFGQNGVSIQPGTMADIHGCLVDHGVAFGVLVWTPRADGARVDVEMKYFPIEYLWWDWVVRCFKARCDPESIAQGDIPEIAPGRPDPRFGVIGGVYVPVIHGDGRWVVFQRNEITPFRHGCLLPASLVWARHAFACRDWAKGSVAHGSAKVIGTLPESVALQNENGLTPEALAFLTLLQAIESADSPAGIAPAGSDVQFLTNNSTAWQVWKELVTNAEKAAARIYLGTDGTLGTQGDAPGVDITQLFGVATTKVRGDLEIIHRAIQTGVIEPWAAINFGDSTLAPQRQYLVPDEDLDHVKAENAKRVSAYWTALKLAHDAGIVVDQAYCTALAKDLGVTVPTLGAPPVVAPPKPAASPDGETKVTTPNATPPAAPPPAALSATPDVLRIARLAAALVPTPKDGAPAKPVDLEDIAQRAAALVPTPKDGAPAAPVDLEDIAQRAAARIPLTEIAIQVASQIPRPRDGRDGRDAPAVELSFAQKNAAFLADVKESRDLGLDLDVGELARLHGVPEPKDL